MSIKTAKKNKHAGSRERRLVMERVSSLLVGTYRKICEPLGIVPSLSELTSVYEIGMKAYDKSRYKAQRFFPGVADTLNFLIYQKDSLILLTKGDRIAQNLKIQSTGVAKWFEKYISPRRKMAEQY